MLSWNVQKSKIMASGPITSWQIDGETISEQLYEHIFSCQLVMSTIKEEAGQRAKEG